MLYLGELAAVITSITYAINSTLFTAAGRKVGAMIVNRLRLVAACVFLAVGQWVITGSPWPQGASWDRWFWLGASGIVGLALGDAFLFQAFIWVGPRISMLMMSLAPIIAAVAAWIFLGESLSIIQIAGVLITLLGISWVILDKNGKPESKHKNYRRGILFGLGASAGQGLGLVLAKPGLADSYFVLSANFMRMFTALIVIWLAALIQRKIRLTFREVRAKPAALWAILGGAFSGPFLGVSLSLFALQNTSIGVASTLMALPPIFLLPVDAFYFHEKIGWGSILGTLVAITGVALLFLF